MKSIVIIIVLFLSGCMYQTVDDNDWRLGTEFCKSKNSEIYKIEANFLGSERYTCRNLEYKNQQ